MQKVNGLPNIESARGIAALMVSHCAGMLDLVALPLWVGTLVAHYRFNPQQAGTLPTLFLLGASLSSVFFASRFNSVNSKWAAVIGFAAAASAFALCSGQTTIAALAPLHFAGGLAAGTALSCTHGTIGRALNLIVYLHWPVWLSAYSVSSFSAVRLEWWRGSGGQRYTLSLLESWGWRL